MASEEGKFNENALPEAYTNPQQRMEKQAKDRKIKAFVEWLDDLPNKGVVHLLELLGVNEDARSKRLDGEASRGKPAVDLNRVHNWADEEVVEGPDGVDVDEDGSINRVNLKCYHCGKKGHSITQCRMYLAEQKGKGKGGGERGGVGDRRVISRAAPRS